MVQGSSRLELGFFEKDEFGCYYGLLMVEFVFGDRIGVDLLLNTLHGGGGSVTKWMQTGSGDCARKDNQGEYRTDLLNPVVVIPSCTGISSAGGHRDATNGRGPIELFLVPVSAPRLV